MKRVTFLITVLSAAALLLCACSSEEGTLSPEPTGSKDDIAEGVSGNCLNNINEGTNRITCEVYVYATGMPCLSFEPCVSYTDGTYGTGYYACERCPELAPPMDGTILYVYGYTAEGAWGISSLFAWTQPNETNIVVNEY
ncbi:MAG: hypothetical protein PVH29_01890 [Candidatus Zixiibacteriota bacterium]|jgi:hypothetical protein